MFDDVNDYNSGDRSDAIVTRKGNKKYIVKYRCELSGPEGMISVWHVIRGRHESRIETLVNLTLFRGLHRFEFVPISHPPLPEGNIPVFPHLEVTMTQHILIVRALVGLKSLGTVSPA